MAYQAKRKEIYQEEFQLVEADGTVAHTLQVSLDADSVVRKLSEKHLALVHAMQEIQQYQRPDSQEEPERQLAMLGSTLVDLLEAVFGQADTRTIVEFYENRYLEMCQQVLPFVTEVVIPQVRRISQNSRKEVLSQYSRKQLRKGLGRRG